MPQEKAALKFGVAKIPSSVGSNPFSKRSGSGSVLGDMDANCYSDCSSLAPGSLPQASTPSGSALPPALRVRLYELFVQIEREFEVLYTENLSLQERVDWLSDHHQVPAQHHLLPGKPPPLHHHHHHHHHHQPSNVPPTKNNASIDSGVLQMPAVASMSSIMNSVASSIPKGVARGIYAHKLRSHTNKLRQQTNRIMFNLKGPPSINCVPVRRYMGHKDGIWEVSVSRMGLPIVGTASADHSAIVWGMHSARPLLTYAGHTGSVNSIRFHPNKELVLTASGDGTAHIWQCAVHLYHESSSGRMASSEDELAETALEPSDEFGVGNRSTCENFDSLTAVEEHGEECSVLRTPLRSLVGHNGVVIAADWLPVGEQAVTAGWDRLACIWDTQTGQLLHQLTGHDEELTHTAAHPSARLVVTSSKDSTFRLWDFRESIHSVSVFQGHQDTVTSAIFTREDQVVSGSDDRSVRIWDLRNMRSPVATIHSDSAVNRLSISATGLIAIPFDNRNVRLYDLSGQRVGRLPRNSRQGHSRMVCSTAWSEDTKPNLFTCGFDRVTLGWNVQPRENVKENEGDMVSSQRPYYPTSGAAGQPVSGLVADTAAKMSLRGAKDALRESNASATNLKDMKT